MTPDTVLFDIMIDKMPDRLGSETEPAVRIARNGYDAGQVG